MATNHVFGQIFFMLLYSFQANSLNDQLASSVGWDLGRDALMRVMRIDASVKRAHKTIGIIILEWPGIRNIGAN